MVACFSASGFFVHTPCGPRKSGMPESVEMPAPVRTTMRDDSSTQRRAPATAASRSPPEVDEGSRREGGSYMVTLRVWLAGGVLTWSMAAGELSGQPPNADIALAPFAVAGGKASELRPVADDCLGQLVKALAGIDSRDRRGHTYMPQDQEQAKRVRRRSAP